jgi:hypothetical protein
LIGGGKSDGEPRTIQRRDHERIRQVAEKLKVDPIWWRRPWTWLGRT